jgi:rSAM/selenodomain-associated transferase 1
MEGADRFIGVYPSHQSGYFDPVIRAGKVHLFNQQGEDLGQRMRHAFQQRFEDGYDKVLIIGSDSPTLPTAYIRQAFDSEREVMLGPSTDGGYYLIGMNRKVTDIFEGIAWGSERVLAETINRLQTLKAGLELLPVWYDVDRPEDLRFLKTHLECMRHAEMTGYPETLRFLQQLNWEPVA